MTDPRTTLVGQGYDAIVDRFAEWKEEIVGDRRRWWSDQLETRLQDGDRVLELGCGAGVPDTSHLAARFRVTGVDVSAEQIRRARANVPDATFVQGDFTALELPPESFEAVVAFYSLNHVPRELLGGLFTRAHSWLVPGGYFLAALGTSDDPGWTGEWLGTTMFFSSFPPKINRQLLKEGGFDVVLDELVTMREPEPDGEGTWQWILAQR